MTLQRTTPASIGRSIRIVAITSLFLCCQLTAVGEESGGEFERSVKPILVEHCFACHAEGSNEGGFSLDPLLVAEDGGDLQIVAITPRGRLIPLCALVGHDESEIAGPAFSPDFSRLYFSSQRGTSGRSQDGMTFEIRGPFEAGIR